MRIAGELIGVHFFLFLIIFGNMKSGDNKDRIYIDTLKHICVQMLLLTSHLIVATE